MGAWKLMDVTGIFVRLSVISVAAAWEILWKVPNGIASIAPPASRLS